MCNSILTQLGRMFKQDGYSNEDIIMVADMAATLKNMGITVKTIEKYIRNSRVSGNWDW